MSYVTNIPFKTMRWRAGRIRATITIEKTFNKSFQTVLEKSNCHLKAPVFGLVVTVIFTQRERKIVLKKTQKKSNVEQDQHTKNMFSVLKSYFPIKVLMDLHENVEG